MIERPDQEELDEDHLSRADQLSALIQLSSLKPFSENMTNDLKSCLFDQSYLSDQTRPFTKALEGAAVALADDPHLDAVTEAIRNLLIDNYQLNQEAQLADAGFSREEAQQIVKSFLPIYLDLKFRYLTREHQWTLSPLSSLKTGAIWEGPLPDGVLTIGEHRVVEAPYIVIGPQIGVVKFSSLPTGSTLTLDEYAGGQQVRSYQKILDFCRQADLISTEEHRALLDLTKPSKHRTHDKALRKTVHPIDPLTNSIYGRGKNSIGPQAYWSGGPIDIKTGKGTAALSIWADTKDLDFATADERLYRLDDGTRYWLDLALSLFLDGREKITAPQLLKTSGLTNPYDPGSQEVLNDAFKELSLCARTLIRIDTTNEKRNHRKKHGLIYEGTRQVSPLASLRFDVDEYTVEGGNTKVHDFSVSLMTPTVEEAFPLYAYAKHYGQITSIDLKERTFETVSPSQVCRRAWTYILRVIHAEKMSNTILYDTLFREINLPAPEVSPLNSKGVPRNQKQLERATKDAIRKQQGRIIKQLIKMLDEKTKEGYFKNWRYHLNAKTKKYDGIIITPGTNSGLRNT